MTKPVNPTHAQQTLIATVKSAASDVPDYASLLRLDGKIIIVAGAGQGIGRQTCHALAAVGAKVLCVDRDMSLASSVASEVGGVAHQADITDRLQVQGVLNRAFDLGVVSGIVDIVGIAHFEDLIEANDESWDRAILLNAKHAFLLTSMGGRFLAEGGGGTIVMVASISGMFAAERHGVYGMAKAGVIALAKSAASELGGAGVRVNTVSPGVVWTPRMSAHLGMERRAEFDALVPLGSVAMPADIASAILFLCSDLARDISGQNLVVDGGTSAKSPLGESRF